MEYIISQFQKLVAIPSPSGYTRAAAQYLMNELEEMGYAPRMTPKGCVAVELGGEGEPILLSAHVDTLGGMVAEVKGDGRLRIRPVGGLNANNVEAENCTVFTRDGRSYGGTCQLVDASIHVNRSYSDTKRDFTTVEIVLDENVKSRADAEALGIDTGDYVCFDPRTCVTGSGYIKSRFIDDKMSAAVLLGVARDIKAGKVAPARKTYAFFTVYEEVGHGASAAVADDIVEFISVDMGCVGAGLKCTEREVSICVADSSGPSDYGTVSAMVALAKEKAIPYALDIYPMYGSDADAALRAGADVRHTVIGSGVYASHGYERTHRDGVKAALDLVEAYISAKK